jgi:hypothetical protein
VDCSFSGMRGNVSTLFFDFRAALDPGSPQNRFNPKSKELASCLASSRLLLTLLTLSLFNYLTASAGDAESDAAWASGDAAVSPLPLRSA